MKKRRKLGQGESAPTPKKKPSIKDIVRKVEAEADQKAKSAIFTPTFDVVVSTGSTLLDLTISGKRSGYGGIPGGIVVEVFGPSSSGKTALVVEIGASAQYKGWEAKYKDPEGRLDRDYATLTGLSLKDQNYYQPNSIEDVFEDTWNWKPKKVGKDTINTELIDSLAALLAREGVVEEDEKLAWSNMAAARRAIVFSEGFRKICRFIEQENRLLVCTNQLREDIMKTFGSKEKTPGGKGVGYYSSLRIRVGPPPKGWKIERKKKYGSKEVKKHVGIISRCYVAKSSIDDPYRYCDIYIMFGHGIDDIRTNLAWLKDAKQDKVYDCFGKTCKSLDGAVSCIEESGKQKELRDETIKVWREIEELFYEVRKPKLRF